MTPVGWQYEDDASCGTVACARGRTSGVGADGEVQFAKSAYRAASEGVANHEIVRRVVVCANTVRKWRRSFPNWGVAGVGVIEPGRGRKPWLSEGTVAEAARITQHELPADGSTHWTTRTLGQRLGIGSDSVARIWQDHDLKPWKVEISNDPVFADKLVDVLGLYLTPPERAVVFSVDEKTQCQAWDRTQPGLPLRPGRAGMMSHDHKRHGTTDLYAALNIATGKMLTDCRERHTAKDFVGFLCVIDRDVPAEWALHLVLDNRSAHKAPEVQAWLAHPKRRRFYIHFTPAISSRVNLVERWFKELTDKRLRRGTFNSVPALTGAVELWVVRWNDDLHPFVWHTPAADTIAKVRRGRVALAQLNSQTDH